MRWGMVGTAVQSFTVLIGFFLPRMGKTIQIISLLVSDRKRPNLVIAYVNSHSHLIASC